MVSRKSKMKRSLCWAGSLVCLLACSSARAAAETAPVAMIENVDFRALPLIDATRMLSQQTGLNIVSSTDAGKIPVSLFLHNVTAKSAIEELCKAHNLWFRQDEKSGIVRIVTMPEFERDLVSFREEKTEVFTLLYPNAVSIALAIRDLYGDRVQLSFNREATTDEANDLNARFDRFDIVDQRSQGLGLFSSNSTGSGGSNTSVSGPGNNRFSSSTASSDNALNGPQMRLNSNRRDAENTFRSLTPEQADLVQKLIEKGNGDADAALQKFRRQTASIFVSISRKNNIVLLRTSDQKSLDEISTLVHRLDVPTPLVLLEVKVLSVDLDDGLNSMFDFQFSDGVTTAGGFSSGSIQPPLADVLSGAARRAAPLDVGGTAVRNGDLTFQFVNKNFRARLQMLQTKNKVTTLATPLLMTANNEVSRLFIGEERPIVRNISSNTVQNNNTSTTTPNTTIEFRPVGTTLLLTPNINSDRTVTLRLLQENSSINSNGATIPVVTGNGSVQNQPVDVVASRTVSGTIIAKDDLEIAVGGLIEENVTDQRAEVPVLGRIPVLGIPFRRQNSGRTRHELIVVVRPHILSTPSESECISKDLMNQLSLHPNSPDVRGTMNTFNKAEVLEPDPPKNLKQDIFRLDHVKSGP